MKFFITIYLCLIGLISSAQLTASKDTITSQGEISWNTGYVVYDSFESNSGSLEDQKLDSIAVFPNPVAESINIRFSGLNPSTFQLVNFKGEILYTGKSTSVDMSSYPKGVYFLQFLDEQKSIKSNYKVVKQ